MNTELKTTRYFTDNEEALHVLTNASYPLKELGRKLNLCAMEGTDYSIDIMKEYIGNNGKMPELVCIADKAIEHASQGVHNAAIYLNAVRYTCPELGHLMSKVEKDITYVNYLRNAVMHKLKEGQ